MTTGSCLCGDITFEVSGPITQMTHCHCTMCRKEHGSMFATYAEVAAKDFAWTKGEDKIETFKSSDILDRRFCGTCGSVMPSTEHDGEPVYIPAGLFVDDIVARADAHIFVGSKAEWYEIQDDLPQFEEYTDPADPSVEYESKSQAAEGTVGGGCLCGAVAFEYTGVPEFIMNCHCSRCRRAKSAAHATNAFIKPEYFKWTRGEDHVRIYKLPEAERFGHAFCDTCGSSVPRWSEGAPVVNVPVGSIDGDPGGRPKAHIFVGSKACWYEPPENAPHFEEMPTG